MPSRAWEKGSFLQTFNHSPQDDFQFPSSPARYASLIAAFSSEKSSTLSPLAEKTWHGPQGGRVSSPP